MSLTVIGSIERGHYVARVPSHGICVAVPLAPIANRMGHPEVGALCASMGTPEVSGRIWRRMKRRAKKGFRVVKKVVKVAKKVANNQIVKTLWNSAKAAIPPPYNAALVAVETGVRFGVAVAKGFPKAKKSLPVVKALADGKISLPAAKRAAAKIGLRPNTVRDAAAMIKMKAAARTNPKLAAVFKTAATIEAARKATKERIVTAPSGRKYAVSVRRAA